MVARARPLLNLRSSRQTKLAESLLSHVVCDWMGSSEDVTRKYYYPTIDENFARALGRDSGAKQNPKRSVAASA